MSDIDTLKNFNCPENVIEHCIAVSKNAGAIAARVKIQVDKDMIKRGALLHDIGRCRTHGIEHGVEGGRIIRELGLGEELAKIAERHIGAGISSDEAEKVGLPPGEYCPESPEEKIVAYADNITRGKKLISFDEGLARFKKELGEGHPSIRRMEELHSEIQGWIGGK
jgi:uncharacterized protein